MSNRNRKYRRLLQKSGFLETEEALAADHSLADDDVIQEMDLKEPPPGPVQQMEIGGNREFWPNLAIA